MVVHKVWAVVFDDDDDDARDMEESSLARPSTYRSVVGQLTSELAGQKNILLGEHLERHQSDRVPLDTPVATQLAVLSSDDSAVAAK